MLIGGESRHRVNGILQTWIPRQRHMIEDMGASNCTATICVVILPWFSLWSWCIYRWLSRDSHRSNEMRSEAWAAEHTASGEVHSQRSQLVKMLVGQQH